MTEENKKNNPIENHIRAEQGIYQNDEIDLRELFLILWNKKFLIFSFTFIAAILGAIYAASQPNIYEAKAVFKINTDPYGIAASKGIHGRASVESFEYLSGDIIKQKIKAIAKPVISIMGLKVSLNKKTNEVSVSSQGNDAEKIFNQVSVYSQFANQVYVNNELQNVQAQLIPIKILLDKQDSPEVKQAIAEKYAYLIYKEALLKSGSVELVKLIKKATKPTAHIKPKRALIVVLTILLAVMLSIFITLIHHYFRKKQA